MSKKQLFLIILILFILLPLGLLSDYSAWGEWETQTYKQLIGFIPQGIQNATTFSIIPDYGEGSVVMYYISAIIGGGLLYFILFLMTKLTKPKS